MSGASTPPPRARRAERDRDARAVKCCACAAWVRVVPGAHEARCQACGAAWTLSDEAARRAAAAGVARDDTADVALRAALEARDRARAELSVPGLREAIDALRAASRWVEAARLAGVALEFDPATATLEGAVLWQNVWDDLDPIALRVHLPHDGTAAVLALAGQGVQPLRAAVIARRSQGAELPARVSLESCAWPPMGLHRWDLEPWHWRGGRAPGWPVRVGLHGAERGAFERAMRRPAGALREATRRGDDVARAALATQLQRDDRCAEALALYQIRLADVLADARLRALAPWRLRGALHATRAERPAGYVASLRWPHPLYVRAGTSLAGPLWILPGPPHGAPAVELGCNLWQRPLELDELVLAACERRGATRRT